MAYRALFNTVFARMDPERAHERAFRAIRSGRRLSSAVIKQTEDPRTVMGLRFPNAVGLAAGFDKNARAVPGLLALGFGHVEIGTVTGQAQPGNDRPRLFRLRADDAIVNRMGFNNHGAAVVADRLARLRATKVGRDAVIGVNIGKTKMVAPERAVEDYILSAGLLAPHASYLVVNVSSPNTPGLRDLQAVETLRPLLQSVVEVAQASAGRVVPTVVKIAPDLADADVDAVTDLALELELAGLIAANTTIERPDSLRTKRSVIDAAGAGGLSGPILAERSRAVLERIVNRADQKLAVISVGGIDSGAEARRRLELGADLVQAYTGFVYQGPLWPSRLARELAAPAGLER